MALKPPGCAAEGGAQCRWGLGLTPRRRARNRNSSVRTWPPTRRRRPCSATVHGTPAARRLRPPALVPRLECVGLRWFLLSGTGEAGPDSADYRGAVPPTSPGEDGGGGGQRRSACGPGTLTPARPGDGPGSRCRCWRVPAGGREEQRDTAPRPRTCAAPTAVASTRHTRGAGGGTRGPEGDSPLRPHASPDRL